jgi:hypothetical protein
MLKPQTKSKIINLATGAGLLVVAMLFIMACDTLEHVFGTWSLMAWDAAFLALCFTGLGLHFLAKE